MHETSIARNIIEAVGRRIAEGEIVGNVSTVFLRVGRLTAVAPDNLRFMFRVLSRDSMFEGAQLEIEEIPIKAKCDACGAAFEVEEFRLLCTYCGSPDVDILSGRELIVTAVEVN